MSSYTFKIHFSHCICPFFITLEPNAFTPSYKVLFFYQELLNQDPFFIKYPIPEHSGHAPNGLLKENILGDNSGKLNPQCGHA